MDVTTSPKKILFVITKSYWGGAQRYVYDLATAAAARGFDVVVAVGGQGLLIQKLQEAGVRTIALDTLTQHKTFLGDLLSFGSLFTLIKIIKEERSDVLHVNSAKAGGLGALAGRWCGVPHIIFTAHGWEFMNDRGALSRVGIRLFSWLTILLSHTTIAVSQAVRSATVGWPFVTSKIVVIRNGVEDFPLLSRGEARAALIERVPTLASVFKEGMFAIGTVAELTPIKGLTYGIEAIAALPEEMRKKISWTIISDGALRDALQQQIDRLGLHNRVFLAGFMPEARTSLRAFDLFLLPSLFEALAYVLIEAGHAELPVIASKTGGIPEIVEDGTSGILVPPRDPQAIAHAIEKLMPDQELRITLGTALHAKVMREFSIERMVDETLEVYARQRQGKKERRK